MQPRVIFYTHYQVDEPAYMELLVHLCTSGVQGRYDEDVSKRLARELRSRDKKFNEAAGKYAVGLARSLDLVTQNINMTDQGFLIYL